MQDFSLFGTTEEGARDSAKVEPAVAGPEAGTSRKLRIRREDNDFFSQVNRKVEEGANLVSKAEEGGKVASTLEDMLFKKGDPAFEMYGAATKSHPEEYARIMEDLEKRGVKVIDRPDGLAYSPSSTPGKAGEIYLDREASFSAVSHEYQHLLDDAARGFPGKEALFQPNTRWEMEAAAYGKEISLARRSGDLELIRQLEELRTQEWRRIFMPHLVK